MIVSTGECLSKDRSPASHPCPSSDSLMRSSQLDAELHVAAQAHSDIVQAAVCCRL